MSVHRTGAVLAALALTAGAALSQSAAPQTASLTTAPAEPEMILLDFPENMEVRVLIEYVRKRMGMNLLYDESIGRKRITIAASTKVPKDSLEGLFRSVLKIVGLTLVDIDEPGWKRIVPSEDFLRLTKRIAKDPAAVARLPATTPATQAVALKHLTTATAEKLIKPFMSTPGGNVFAIPGQSLLILSDYADNLRLVREILELLDQAGPEAQIQFVPLKHRSAVELARQVGDLLRQKTDVAGRGDGKTRPGLTLTPDALGNRIVVVSRDTAHVEALKLIETLDVPSQLETRTHRFRYVDPARIDRLIRAMADTAQRKASYHAWVDVEGNMLIVTGPDWVHEQIAGLSKELDVRPDTETVTYTPRYVRPNKVDQLARRLSEAAWGGPYKSVFDDESGLLIVTAPKAVHERIRSLCEQLDVAEPDPDRSFMRFYRLVNTTAGQVMATIQALDVGEAQLANLLSSGQVGLGSLLHDPRLSGPNRPPPAPGEPLPTPPSYRPSEESTTQPAAARAKPETDRPSTNPGVPKVIADANTNTIIVVGPPELQKLYKQLISILDKRRPQVLVEVTLVTLDTSDNFSLGVELSRRKGLSDGDSALVFSSFGLGTVDQTTGVIGLPNAGLGFNGVVVSPGTVNVVLRALAGCGRGKVLAAPKVLVNDNATATLSSVSEAPFTSVNASDTVSTTSFAGYASAGTTLTVTPHISEGEHIQMHYSITLNSFTGEGAGGVPPPRQTNTLSSEVTVPDGYAVVVGGLTREDVSESITKIPWLGDVPGLKHLFRLRTKNRSQNTLFVFLRPVALRDDGFEDLKCLSSRQLRLADLPPNLPASGPLMID